MVIDRLKLINDVAHALPGIAVGNIALEGADTLVFSEGHVYSYNSTVSVDVKLSEDVKLSGSVKAQDFYNCLTKLPGNTIDIEMSEQSWKISDGKIRVSMKLLPVGTMLDALKSLRTSDDGWIAVDGKEFQSVLKVCFIRDNSAVSGVFFRGNKAFSTNRWIVNRCEMNSEYPEFWLSVNGVTELMKWDNFEAVKFEKQWLHLRSSDGVIFSLRTLCVDNYPIANIEKILADMDGYEKVTTLGLSDAFSKAIRRASVFSDVVEQHDTISISFGKEVKILGKRVSGDFEEIVDGMTTSFDSPIEMIFDLTEFVTSDGLFDSFSILSKDGNVDTGSPVHVVLSGDGRIKLFTSLVN